MAKAHKLLKRMRNNPAGDWLIDDVQRVCDQFQALNCYLRRMALILRLPIHAYQTF